MTPLEKSGWMVRPELDLFSSENLERVNAELVRSESVVFGWHYFYRVGSCRDSVSFTTVDDYVNYVERARPGDHLTLFSLDHLVEHSFLHLSQRHSTSRVELNDGEKAIINRHLLDSQELVAVRRFVGPLSGIVEAEVDELWEGDEPEDLQATMIAWTWGRGERFLFDAPLFDLDGIGGLIKYVSPGERRRVHAMVDAKRPDPNGLVPLGGAY